MKATVNQEGCISCGLCVGTCPDVFRFNENNTAEPIVDPIPAENVPGVQRARDDCPVHVIDIH